MPSPQEDLSNPQPINDKDVSCTDPEVKSALKEITSILNTVVKRVERVENELKRVSSASSSSESSSPKHKKVFVPLVVRVSVVM